MSQDKCFICHNRHFDKKSKCWIEIDTPLIKEKLIWDMFDGTHCEVDIFKCNNCIKFERILEEFKLPKDWVDETIDKIIGRQK